MEDGLKWTILNHIFWVAQMKYQICKLCVTPAMPEKEVGVQMARPIKQGLEYFPLDVVMDDKVALIEAEHGIVGFGLLIKLFQKIYSEGYYYTWTEKEQLLFSKRVSVDRNKVNDIINDCLKWGVFHEELYNNFNILTSRGIQKRYLSAAYKRSTIELYKEFLLIDVSDRKNIVVTTIIDTENDISSDVCDSKSTQSKEKESKEKESKEKLQEGGSSSFSSHDELSATEENDNKDFKELAKLYQKCGFQVNGLTPQWLEEILKKYGFEWCRNAFIEADKRGKRTKKYVEGILDNWNKDGGMKLGGDSDGASSKDIEHIRGKIHGAKGKGPDLSHIGFKGTGEIDDSDLI